MALISEGGFDGSCSLIPLNCDEGRRLLEESEHKGLVPHFCKQVNRTYCGLCSVAICVNGILAKGSGTVSDILRAKTTKGTLSEEDVLSLGGKDAKLDMEDLKLNGITLSALGKLGPALGLESTVFYAIEEGATNVDTSSQQVETVDVFRSIILQNLLKDCHFVVVNYDMCLLGYRSLFGHFSPLGGYHHKQDRFLVLDVWPDTPPAWVKSEDLFKATKDVDKCSGKPRGFCILSLSGQNL